MLKFNLLLTSAVFMRSGLGPILELAEKDWLSNYLLWSDADLHAVELPLFMIELMLELLRSMLTLPAHASLKSTNLTMPDCL